MVSLLSSMNIAQGALSVNEKAISVVSHNVANMNTEGYHKQRANLETRNISGVIGNNVDNQVRSNGGVKIANILRYNDDYLNNYYRDQLSQKSKLEQQLGNLQDLAKIFDDLEGQGLDAALSDFYESLNNLNQYPASSTARTDFIEKTKTLVSVMHTKNAQLNELTGEALGDGESPEALEKSKIYVQYRELNNSLEELAAVNKALQTTQTGTLTANNLLDKRDLILGDIAQFVDISVKEYPNGSVNVSTGNISLVKGATVTGKLELQTAKQYCIEHPDEYPVYPDDWDGEAAVINILDPTQESRTVIVSNANSQIQGGALGGLLHSATDNEDGETNAGTVQKALNTLAQSLSDIFNDLNVRDGAYSISHGDTKILVDSADDNYLFVNKSTGGRDGITAGNIDLASNLYTTDGIWDIACAYIDPSTPLDENSEHAVGNSQNVMAMLLTRSQGQDALNGMSVEEYYTSLLGKIASAGDSSQSLYDTQCDVVDSIANQLDQAYGVDLNEELVDLVKYQTAYAAAAQVFNVVNSCLDTLMSLGR